MIPLHMYLINRDRVTASCLNMKHILTWTKPSCVKDIRMVKADGGSSHEICGGRELGYCSRPIDFSAPAGQIDSGGIFASSRKGSRNLKAFRERVCAIIS